VGSNKTQIIVIRDSFKILNASAEAASKSFALNSLSKIPFNHNLLQSIKDKPFGFALRDM
jgi:hypothetical protein